MLTALVLDDRALIGLAARKTLEKKPIARRVDEGLHEDWNNWKDSRRD